MGPMTNGMKLRVHSPVQVSGLTAIMDLTMKSVVSRPMTNDYEHTRSY